MMSSVGTARQLLSQDFSSNIVKYKYSYVVDILPICRTVQGEFEKNGYLRFKYTRNKYPLRFNYDPSKIKDDKEFGATNSINTFYEFPLKALSPNLVDDWTPREEREYYKNNPK